MPLKKATLCSAYSSLQCCLCPHTTIYPTSTSPSVLPIPRARPTSSNDKKRKIYHHQHRPYATVKTHKTYDFRDNLHWPCFHPSKPPTTPNPYDIFDLHPSSPYSKHKFYELVKLYHPDRQSSTFPLPYVERLERYRLVVAAHEILSDPIKRRAYDAYGSGWGPNAAETAKYTYTRYASYSSSSPGAFGHAEDSPFANATWEDWERWYARTTSHHHHHSHFHRNPNAHDPDAKPNWNFRDGSKWGQSAQSYSGNAINPNAFASFIILIAIVSGILQATHATSSAAASGSIENRAAAFTAQTHQFMNDRKLANSQYNHHGFTGSAGDAAAAAAAAAAADGRIQHFLERRDPTRYGLKDEEEETYRRHFAGRRQSSLPPPASPRPTQQSDTDAA